jgi:hypothetical protein
VRLVRTSIEATVLAVGWLLGGTVGVGTVVYAFGIGPLVQLFVRLTPKRVLAVSGWAAVAEASELGVKSNARRNPARRNRKGHPRSGPPPRHGTLVERHMRPTPLC